MCGASGKNDSSSCVHASSKHACVPCPSCLAQFVAPADHALVYAAVTVDAFAIQLCSHEAQPYELCCAFLAFLFGCVSLQPEVQFVGEVLVPASDTVGVSILLITNYLPSLSVEQTATSSDS